MNTWLTSAEITRRLFKNVYIIAYNLLLVFFLFTGRQLLLDWHAVCHVTNSIYLGMSKHQQMVIPLPYHNNHNPGKLGLTKNNHVYKKLVRFELNEKYYI